MIYTIKIFDKIGMRIYNENADAVNHEDAVMHAMQKLGKKLRTPYHLVEVPLRNASA